MAIGYPIGQRRSEEGKSEGLCVPSWGGFPFTRCSPAAALPGAAVRPWMSRRDCGELLAGVNQNPVRIMVQGSKEMLLEWLETVVYFPLKYLRHVPSVLFM